MTPREKQRLEELRGEVRELKGQIKLLEARLGRAEDRSHRLLMQLGNIVESVQAVEDELFEEGISEC